MAKRKALGAFAGDASAALGWIGQGPAAAGPRKLKTPYKNLLPALKGEERQTLRESIKARGVDIPVTVSEDGTVLDGHHRLAVNPQAPQRVLLGLKTEPEKRATAFRLNLARRQLTADERGRVIEAMKWTAKALRTEGKTQEQAAALLGVSQPAISKWFRDIPVSNITKHKANRWRKASAKVSPETQRAIIRQAKAGERIGVLAKRYGVSHGRVSQIVKAAQKPRPRAAKAAKPGRRVTCPHCRRAFTIAVRP